MILRPLLPLVLVLSGCSNEDEWTRKQPATVTAEGVLTLDGKPVDFASITLLPIEPGTHAATSLTDKSGRFAMQAFPSKPGAVPGEYKVRVGKTIEVGAEAIKVDLGEDAAHAVAQDGGANVSWKNVLPDKYADPATSGLTIVVPPDGTTSLKIELKSGT